MVQIAQCIDNRHAGIVSELFDYFLAMGADHQRVHIAGHHPGGIFQRFCTGELAVPPGKKKSLTTKTINCRLKRDPGSGGGLFENKGNGFALEGVVFGARKPFSFQDHCLVNKRVKLFL